LPGYRPGKVDVATFERRWQAWGARLDGLAADTSLPFRRQGGGDYEIPVLTLRP